MSFDITSFLMGKASGGGSGDGGGLPEITSVIKLPRAHTKEDLMTKGFHFATHDTAPVYWYAGIGDDDPDVYAAGVTAYGNNNARTFLGITTSKKSATIYTAALYRDTGEEFIGVQAFPVSSPYTGVNDKAIFSGGQQISRPWADGIPYYSTIQSMLAHIVAELMGW